VKEETPPGDFWMLMENVCKKVLTKSETSKVMTALKKEHNQINRRLNLEILNDLAKNM
jgi:hypothetical protein